MDIGIFSSGVYKSHRDRCNAINLTFLSYCGSMPPGKLILYVGNIVLGSWLFAPRYHSDNNFLTGVMVDST